MRVATTLAAATALAAGAIAQVQTQVRAFTPLTFTVTDGATTATQTQPAGLLSSFGAAGAWIPSPTGPSPSSSVQWSGGGTSAWLLHSLNNFQLAPNVSAAAGPHEFLVEFTSITPKAATIRVGRELELAAGATAPTVSLDIDNDGTIDVADLSTANVETLSVVLGPQPTQVRIIVQASLGLAEFAQDFTYVTAEPDNDLEITRIVTGCAAVAPPPPPVVRPSFQNTGVDLQNQFQTGVVVLGLAPQPTLLSTFSFNNLPCLLLPEVDLTIASTGAANLPIPASARPITFYAQSAGLLIGELVVSDGYQVRAF
jgi:hypothetical protein